MENSKNFIQKYWSQILGAIMVIAIAVELRTTQASLITQIADLKKAIEKAAEVQKERDDKQNERFVEENMGGRKDAEFSDEQLEKQMILRDETLYWKLKYETLYEKTRDKL